MEDSFGYVSEATYDYRFGRKALTTSINDNRMLRRYDAFDRTERIYGPYQMDGRQPADPQRPTIRFAYHPDAEVPWARTEHLDRFRDTSDPIETVQFMDGLKRGIQTKKDAAVHTGSGARDVKIVSGRVTFDALGRKVASYYPTTEPLGQAGQLNRGVDDVQPTRRTFDVLDRVTRTVRPDDTVTERSYGFGPDRRGVQRRLTTITDAEDNRRWVYRDVRRLITAVREENGGRTLWTSYRYDPLKQITRVRDAANNVTRIAYDHLGRRVLIANPDTGKVTKEFDPAGNLVRKVTAKLRAEGAAITYDYAYNRRTAIHYPDESLDVAYAYGGPEAPGNRAGRIKRVSDEAGHETRAYGPLGNVVEEVRTVVPEGPGGGPPSATYATEYVYDSFGRLQALVYPDGEAIRYGYDSGGNVNAAVGVKDGTRTTYLRRLEYDKFEKRVYSETGNGIVTTYDYRADNRRLKHLTAGPGGGEPFQDLTYNYDRVGNITELANHVGVPGPGEYGGPVEQRFAYDDLYRLTEAEGTWRHAPNRRSEYQLSLEYDGIHNITQKTQREVAYRPSGNGIVQRDSTYDWDYQYQGPQPHAPTHIGGRSFRYDESGNQLGWESDQRGTRRTIEWDGANRIQAISDNGRTTRYAYDDQGERVLKDRARGRRAYINRYYSVRNGAIATKHVFAGNNRLASVVAPGGPEAVTTATGDDSFLGGLFGSGDTPGNDRAKDALQNPAFGGRTPGGFEDGHPGQGTERRSETGDERSSNVEQNPHLGGTADGSGSDARFLYYVHTDHLGSTNYVTDPAGELYQHLQYFPFGETWVEQRTESRRIRHLFTGKELDAESGLYYFGARYYDPRTSVWVSADPILGEYLPKFEDGKQKKGKNGGVFNSSLLNLYSYTSYNPLVLVDPDGNREEISKTVGGETYNIVGYSGPEICGSSSNCRSTLASTPGHMGLRRVEHGGQAYFISPSMGPQNKAYMDALDAKAASQINSAATAGMIVFPASSPVLGPLALGTSGAELANSDDKLDTAIGIGVGLGGGRLAKEALKGRGLNQNDLDVIRGEVTGSELSTQAYEFTLNLMREPEDNE